MFLKELNKKEAMAFVSLIENLSNIDIVYDESEKDLVKSYIKEFSLPTENREVLDFDTSITELIDSSSRIKNIIYFELVGVALVDGNYEDREIEFLDKVASLFNITRKKQIAYVDYFKKVKELFENTVDDSETKILALETEAMKLLAE